jgi:hypothetical protein
MARFLAEDASRRPKQSGRASKSVANWNGVCDGRKPSKLFKFGRIKLISPLFVESPTVSALPQGHGSPEGEAEMSSGAGVQDAREC